MEIDLQNTPRMTGLRLAVGHQSRVGKDTFAARVASVHGCHTVAIATGVYDIAASVQKYFGHPVEKDPALLQFIGKGMRDLYGEDVWIYRAVKSINDIISRDPTANIIVTDMRFPNEKKILSAMGFKTIMITRDNRVIDRDQNHISETALLGHNFDYYIRNDGPNVSQLDPAAKKKLLDQFHSQIDKFIGNLSARSS